MSANSVHEPTYSPCSLYSSEFAKRHIGLRVEDVNAMTATVNAQDVDDLIDSTIPKNIRMNGKLKLPQALTEQDAQNELRKIAQMNREVVSMIGMGYHNCVTPAVIRRNVLENPSWYTAYTPYQPEISQGRLEALINFQTMISELTAMDLANASLLDEATAAAEAMTLLHRSKPSRTQRSSKRVRNRFLVSADCHPQTINVLCTRAEPIGIEIVLFDVERDIETDVLSDAYGVLVQYPGTTGAICDLKAVIERCHALNTQVAVAADPLALCVLTPPGELGADVVIGSTQRFGVPIGFGGPHAAYIAVRTELKRSLPGRLVGVSKDASGRVALRLTLQTREQHIRREKATSNICTSQVLLAVISSMYAIYHGPSGLREIAQKVNRSASILSTRLSEAGMQIVHNHFFDTVCVHVEGNADNVISAALDQGINLRRVNSSMVTVTVDETTTMSEINRVYQAFKIGVNSQADILDRCQDVIPASQQDAITDRQRDTIPASYRRSSRPLSHIIFSSYRSETGLMRYMHRLANRDIALNRSMIPLGSCTMKLNAAIEMEPVSWPEFANVHPFAPADQTVGYRKMINQLEGWLVEITGFNAVSLQPNSGAQGELAGLFTIRAYHLSRGDAHRDVCLIPSSAHGTNAASAVMAGMEVVVVPCDSRGNIGVGDLTRLAELNKNRLAAAMITYPSTHGVFEPAIKDICDIVHENGGQVYLDGANLNAMVGLAQPGKFGADVAHINLHKTFCIPHGGGGPGVGPICVQDHLSPFLPSHPLEPLGLDIEPLGLDTHDHAATGPVAAAPWGSAGILAISWMYIRMMGADGLREATEIAILNANYVAARLKEAYPILYTGENGFVAHECILDTRVMKTTHGITVEDIAKRLIDYGFHAPTMSFPVPGTLMVEPTESESKEELDRFCDAMLSIAGECQRVSEGEWLADDNPLVNAPHTCEEATADIWPHSYTRAQAVYPKNWLRNDKYWAPVSRIDNAYGDRNIMCSCPPIADS